MAAPKLSIAVEPMEGSKAAYLPLAPARSGQKGHAWVILRLRITNNESSGVTVDGIRFSFPGSSIKPRTMQGVPLVLDPEGSTTAAQAQGMIGPGQTATWSNGRVDLDTGDAEDWAENMVYLPGSAPPRVRVHISCVDFSDEATRTLDLAAYRKPASSPTFIPPFAAGDLRDGEFLVTAAWHWANGGAWGTQIMAHDIGVRAVNGGAWSELLSGKPKASNESWRMWNLPVRAMADGEVESWLNTMDDNEKAGEFPKKTPDPVSGNHLWIKHGDVYALYAHFRKGSIPAELLSSGAKVKAGQFLGRIGNSGNSSNPHTHIELRKGSSSGALRGFPFRGAQVVDEAFTPPKPSDPWVTLRGHGIPKKRVSIWPASTTPGFPVPAAGIARGATWANSFWISTSKRAFDRTAQQLFDDKGRRLTWVSTFLENGKRRWAGIARSGTWANAVWTSSSRQAFEARAQNLFDKQGKRLVHVHVYRTGNKLHWMGIARSGTWASSYWVSDSRAAFEKKAQELFDDKGRRLTFVTTYAAGGKRYWVGLARSGTWANSFWVSSGLAAFQKKAQDLFDQKGRRLVHMHSFVAGGRRYWAGIARSGNWANSFWYSRDLDSFRRTAQDLFEDKGRRLMAVEFMDS